MDSLKEIRIKNRDSKLTSRIMKHITSNRYILPSLVLAVCLVITYFNWDFANTARKTELQSYFEYRARDVNERIKQRVIGYKQILKSTLGLFNASGKVSRAEFRLFCNSQNLDETYPGIQGVGFSLIIPPKEIKKHITAIRKEGFSKYKLWPEGIRETYTSIIYLEPFEYLNLHAFGYDMLSDSIRRKAMETARDSNKAVITGKVNLVQETENEIQAGFLIYLPVYKKGMSHTTLIDRRKNIIGWVYSPFRMNNFMKGIFDERGEDLDVEIYDGKYISDENKMYNTQTKNMIVNNSLKIEKVIDFDGHEWTVLINYTPQLESRLGFNPANVILIVGLSLSILLTMLTYLLLNKRIITINAAEERKTAEVLLNKLQEDQKILLDNIPAWVFYKDTENRFIHVNKTFADIMEKPAEQLEGKTLFDIFPKEQAEAFWKDDKEVIESGKSKNKIIELMHSPKGDIWVQTDKIPFRAEQGNITGLIGFALDITERKKAEESLLETHQIIEGIINSIPVRVFWKDTNLAFLGCNNLFTLDAGFADPKEIIGKNDFQMKWRKQAEQYQQDDREVIESGRPKLNIEEAQTTPDGNIITLLTSKIPLLNSAEEIIGVLGTYVDISERKNAEDELKKSFKQVTKLNAEKDKFFSIIAHDLRSPFNGFIGLTELMADNSENFSQAEFVEHSISLNNAAKKLYKLLEYLLEWSQIQNGAIEFTPNNFVLKKLVSESVDSIYERALQKRIEIINEVDNSQKVYADEKMIGSVLRNLLSNAVKFTRTNGKISIKTEHPNNGKVTISIEDNGVGIPEDDIEKLFKIEEKVRTHGTDGELSIGLGLLLCKEFIDLHGEKIWVESNEKTGSKFSFTLQGANGHEK